MTKQMSKMLVYTGIFFILIFGWYGIKKIVFLWFVAHYQPPPVTVSATVAATKNWPSYLSSVGSLTALNGVDLSSQASGNVREIRFNSGQYVKQGDLLAVLDTSMEEAALKNQQAKLKLAQINYERDKHLFDKNVSSRAALDTRFAELQEAEAGLESVQAQIKQKTITAPFSGRTGIRLVSVGQYVAPGTPIVTLQSLDPLYVLFNLPEQYLPELYINQPVSVVVNLGPGKTVTGKVTAINSKVDPATRQVLVQATIPNTNFVLYPGMYALVNMWLKGQQNKIVVPQTALSYSLSGDYVFVVKNEGASQKQKRLKVIRQYVKIGERRDNEVSILSGLKANDRVITSGQLKLQNGAQVVIDNSAGL